LFSSLIHAVNSIVDHFYTASKDRLESTALCHRCMETGVNPAHKFTEEELIQTFTTGKPTVQCSQKHQCAVADIAPDISFSRLPIVKDVVVGKLLAQGGFGKVFKVRESWNCLKVSVGGGNKVLTVGFNRERLARMKWQLRNCLLILMLNLS